MTPNTSINEIVFSASEAVALTREMMRRQQAGVLKGVHFGTSAVDKRMIPMMAGDLVLICGRPQNGKSLIMQYMLYNAVKAIMADEAINDAAILVTWEVSVEQAMAYWLAVQSGISATDMLMGALTIAQWEELDMAVVKVGTWPLYIIGHSVQRSAEGRRRRPTLTTDAVSLALDYIMNDRRLEPRLIAMDYLQRVHMSRGVSDRNEHYLLAVDWAKDTALQAGCPVVLGTQAGRQVDDYGGIKLPHLKDSQWSSNAEQTADKFISVWMPKNAYEPGERLPEIPGLGEIQVTENLLIMSIVKQKYGPSPLTFALHVEPERLLVADMLLENA